MVHILVFSVNHHGLEATLLTELLMLVNQLTYFNGIPVMRDSPLLFQASVMHINQVLLVSVHLELVLIKLILILFLDQA